MLILRLVGARSVGIVVDESEDIAAPSVATGARSLVATLRELGVNSQIETARSMDRAGFDTHGVHMSDLIAGRASPPDFKGIVACGAFNFGDVLCAGEGLAKMILFNAHIAEQFAAFFNREDTCGLDVRNGREMM